jgi:hypothetical protein
MEGAALYAFAEARSKPVPCFAHATNQIGQSGDLEKGEANGATAPVALIHAVVEAYLDTWSSIRSQRSVSRTATTIRRVNRILQTKSDVSRFSDARY